jgi:aryl-alcohol dehydrogenase-like predicted oxidoreductase
MRSYGYASAAGTSHYRDRFHGRAGEGHFRNEQDLWLSSIGLGTYLGSPDDATDQSYIDSVSRAVELGINVIDTAINYRFQRSERAIGVALRELSNVDRINRSEIVVCTKGGFVPFDGRPPANVREYIEETFVRPGIAEFSDFVGGSHCMTPSYLRQQLDQSLENLGLECIDIYYIHNPEIQLSHRSRDEFYAALRHSFEGLELAVAAGKIRSYGVASWNGFRVSGDARGHHSLDRMVRLARDVAGEAHSFRFIQLPFNLSMPEALLTANEMVAGKPGSVLELASALGISVFASASMAQGKVARDLSDEIREPMGSLATDAQTALQFVRSTPGITTALVGMSRVEHVEENLQLVKISPASSDDYSRLFTTGT